MKYVYLLERDPKIRKEIFACLQSLNPNLKVRYFGELESFAQWIQRLIKDGVTALHAGGLKVEGDTDQLSDPLAAAELDLIICSEDILGSAQKELLQKTYELFLRKGVCTAEQPTAFILTAFDDPQFNIKKLEFPFINNVIYKPFDALLLKQDLMYALSGRKPPTENSLHVMKTKATIEMTKETKMELFSVFGFTTTSQRSIEVGSIAKYYGENFKGENSPYVYARCISCTEDVQQKNLYHVQLEYFGLNPQQAQNIRKKLTHFKKDQIENFNWKKSVAESESCIFLGASEDFHEMKDSLGRVSKKIKFVEYKNFDDFIFDFDSTKHPAISKRILASDLTELQFDWKTQTLMKIAPEMLDTDKVFGMNRNQLNAVPLPQLCTPETWKFIEELMIKKQKRDLKGQILEFKVNGEVRFLKLGGFSLSDPELPEWFGLQLFEALPEEKLAYVKSKSKWPKVRGAVFIDDVFYQRLITEEIQLPDQFFVFKSSAPEDAFWSAVPKDIQGVFIHPYDRNYFVQKMKWHFQNYLDEGDATFITYKSQIPVKVANPVEVVSISEAELVMKYHRELSLGSFRQFVIPHSSDPESSSYIGSCNYCEKNGDEQNPYQVHFVFFGVKDVLLKKIRIWIRENYIQSKEKTG